MGPVKTLNFEYPSKTGKLIKVRNAEEDIFPSWKMCP